MTYLSYLLKKLVNAWKEDKFLFFLVFWFFSIITGPICLIVNLGPLPIFPDSTLNTTPNSVTGSLFDIIFTPLGIIGSILTGYALIFTFILAIPEWGTYLSWGWAIIKSPYTISKWIYQTVKESYANYKASNENQSSSNGDNQK